MAKVADEPRQFANPDDFLTQVREYISVKNTADVLDARKEDLRKAIFAHMDENAEYDDKGNLFVELPQEIDGIVRVEKQRRTVRKIDENAAEDVLKRLELMEECTTTKIVVDEEALMKAFYDGRITEDDLEQIYPAKVTWAVRLAKK